MQGKGIGEKCPERGIKGPEGPLQYLRVPEHAFACESRALYVCFHH